jgi:hypothetical protein
MKGTALPLFLPPAGRPVLGQPPPQIARLADVEQRVLRTVEAIDAGLGRHAGQEFVGVRASVASWVISQATALRRVHR